MTIKITKQEELVQFLTNFRSAREATFVTKTAVKLNKKDVATKQIPNPHGDIFKITLLKGEINFDYEDKVNDARLVEGKTQDFVAASARNGLEYHSNALSVKDSTFYLRVIPERRITEPFYEKANGEKILLDDIKPFMPVAKPSASSGRQDLEKAIPFRTYKLDSIIHMKIDGVMEYTQE